MIAEFRYLRGFVSVCAVLIAVSIISIAIGSVAHFDIMATTAVYFAIGGAVLIGWTVVFVRRRLRAGIRDVASAPKKERYLPLLLDVILLSLFTYEVAIVCVALHAGEHVSRDLAIINCCLFVWSLITTNRDVRSMFRSDQSLASSGLSARKVAALTAAYALPPGRSGGALSHHCIFAASCVWHSFPL